MDAINNIFKTKRPVISMLHLTYLNGKKFKGIEHVVTRAKEDIKSLQEGGVDGILIENWKEESVGEFVSKETENNFASVMKNIYKEIKVPFGINVLNNDYKLGFKLAKEFNASFVELDVFVDKVRSDFENNSVAAKHPFVIDPKPEEIWEYAKSIDAGDIPLFVFVQPKHYEMLNPDKLIEESTKEAIANNASAVLVTKHTGFAPTMESIQRVKRVAGDVPVGIGSGFSAENAKDFLKVVDFAVVGTSIKIDNITDNPVDPFKIKELMSLVKENRLTT